MAKMSRGQLKSLVKECLVELLSEGLSSDGGSLNESISSRPSRRSVPKRVARPALDKVSFDNIVNENVNMLTEDPVMSSIFSDTAKTTLQEQMRSGGSSGAPSYGEQTAAYGDEAARAVASADPTDIFGTSSNNWATLAFSDAKPSK